MAALRVYGLCDVRLLLRRSVSSTTTLSCRRIRARSDAFGHVARDCLIFENHNTRFWRTLKLLNFVQLQVAAYFMSVFYRDWVHLPPANVVGQRVRNLFGPLVYKALPAILTALDIVYVLAVIFVGRRHVSFAILAKGGRSIMLFTTTTLRLTSSKYPLSRITLDLPNNANSNFIYLKVNQVPVSYRLNVARGSLNNEMFKMIFPH